MAKLTREQVLAIRRQFNDGYSASELATAYGRSERAIRDVAYGRSYKRVVDDPDCPPLPSQERDRSAPRHLVVRPRNGQ